MIGQEELRETKEDRAEKADLPAKGEISPAGAAEEHRQRKAGCQPWPCSNANEEDAQQRDDAKVRREHRNQIRPVQAEAHQPVQPFPDQVGDRLPVVDVWREEKSPNVAALKQWMNDRWKGPFVPAEPSVSIEPEKEPSGRHQGGDMSTEGEPLA